MRRAFIIHGWEGKPTEGWMPWLKKELEQRDWEVNAPQMPHPMLPKLEEWLSTINQLVGVPDSETYLVGHSLGCYTILKYLESLSDSIKIGGVVLVAGFAGNLKHPIPVLQSYYKDGLSWDKIRPHCDHYVAIYSKRDNYVREESAHEFAQHLGAKVIENNNWEHFSGVEGIKELPDVLNSLLEMAES
jgi:hypothetical protein